MSTRVIVKAFSINDIGSMQSYFDSLSKMNITDISITSSGDTIVVALIVKERLL